MELSTNTALNKPDHVIDLQKENADLQKQLVDNIHHLRHSFKGLPPRFGGFGLGQPYTSEYHPPWTVI